MIETTFKKQKIFYIEHNDTWNCSELELEASTLSALKAKITKILSEEFKSNEVKVFIAAWSGWFSGVVTSVTDDGAVWIKRSDGSRCKEQANSVYLDNEKNRNHVAKMNEYEKKKDELVDLIKKEQAKMNLFSVEQVKKNG